MPDSYNLIWIQNLRFLACIAVVFLHISGPWLYEIHKIDNKSWIAVTAIHSFTRFCVPVFLMITGALIFKKEHNVVEFYKIRLSRIFRPLIFWSIFYITIFITFYIYNRSLTTFWDIFLFIINSIINGAAYHFWYLYLITILYLFIPFTLRLFVNNKKNKQLYLIIWLIILLLAQISSDNVVYFYLRFIFGYFGYLILGSYLNDIQIRKPIIIYLSISFFLIGFVYTFYPVYSSFKHFNEVAYNWFYYLNVNVVLMSAGLFLLIKNIILSNVILNDVAQHSFGIYFIHLFFIMLLNKLTDSIYYGNVLIHVFLSALLVFVLSYFSIKVFVNIPILKKYIE